MRYQIRYLPGAEKDLRSLPAAVAQRARRGIERLADDPRDRIDDITAGPSGASPNEGRDRGGARLAQRHGDAVGIAVGAVAGVARHGRMVAVTVSAVSSADCCAM